MRKPLEHRLPLTHLQRLAAESIDVMRDRQTGAVVSGDAEHPTEITELWTFVRRGQEPWKLSAIQEA